MRVVKVPLGRRSYPILLGEGLLDKLGPQCAKLGLAGRCAIISDANVASLYARPAANSLSGSGFESVLLTVPAGEKAKTLEVVAGCYDQLAAYRLERGSFIVALGGGVVGDLAGFVAATYLRGIPFVQAPTTLLAQVDSSVGGKVGVNLKTGKNLVGAFHQPSLVICGLETLRTLPRREFVAGLAEVIKYGIIYDARFFERLERDLEKMLQLDSRVLGEVVARCCEIKAEVVAQDERESGLRQILNFGHTLGHALENSVGYGRCLHGEAISIGQVAAAKLSAKLLGLPQGDLESIQQLFARAGLPTGIRLTLPQRAKLLAALKLDKKISHGEIKFVLAERIGKVRWGQSVPEAIIGQVLSQSPVANRQSPI